MKKVIKWILISLSGLFLIYIGYWIFVFTVFTGVFEGHYTKKDLIDNYEQRHSQIDSLKKYFISIVPSETDIDIEFENNRELGIFHIRTKYKYDSNWGLKIKSGKVDSLLQTIGWTKYTLKDLKQKLDEANCISIESGEPITIGFQRSGMGKYYYKMFKTSLNDSLISKFNDGCQYCFYKDNIVLEYGGGAIGSQCFEDFKRTIKNE